MRGLEVLYAENTRLKLLMVEGESGTLLLDQEGELISAESDEVEYRIAEARGLIPISAISKLQMAEHESRLWCQRNEAVLALLFAHFNLGELRREGHKLACETSSGALIVVSPRARKGRAIVLIKFGRPYWFKETVMTIKCEETPHLGINDSDLLERFKTLESRCQGGKA